MAAAPPDDLSRLSLEEIAALAESRTLPPVEQWHPEREGEIDIRIAADGTWYHESDPIRRDRLVRLFSTILRREPGGGYALVTPVEKLAIHVEDAPFVAVEMKRAEGRLAFRLNTGDLVVAGPDHPLALRDGPDGALPYLHVRGDLWAKLARPVYYEVMNLALEQDPAGVTSDGAFFALEPAA
ncbi:MAG: DUF1285 domain-containing protein [Sphingomonadales bacterium]|nr:DUF1285 domain-containing protein [Sphingomonadales bacterium]